MALSNSTTLATFDTSIGYDRVTKDFAAYCDGVLVGFFNSYSEAEAALNEYKYDLLSRTAVETADMEADAAETQQERLVEQADALVERLGQELNDTYGDYQYEPHMAPVAHINRLIALRDRAERRLMRRMGGLAPLDPPTSDPTPSGDPWPDSFYRDATPAEVARFSVTLRDHQTRAKMYLTDPRGVYNAVVCPALLDEADAVLRAEGCGWCGGRHHIQLCPSIWSLLRAPDAERITLELVERMAEAA